MQFVILDAGLNAIQVAEAASEHDVTIYCYRHLGTFPGFLRVEEAEEFYARTHGKLLESFRRRYESEGMDAEKAQRKAEIAAGPRRVKYLGVVNVPKQEPVPARGTEATKSGHVVRMTGPVMPFRGRRRR